MSCEDAQLALTQCQSNPSIEMHSKLLSVSMGQIWQGEKGERGEKGDRGNDGAAGAPGMVDAPSLLAAAQKIFINSNGDPIALS